VAVAQSGTITPYIGSFHSLASYVAADDEVGRQVTVAQAATAVFGARVSIPLNPHLSAEGAVGFSRSNVVLRIADSCVDTNDELFDCATSVSGVVLTTSGRLLFKPGHPNVWGIAGVTYVRHSGTAWRDQSTSSRNDIGAVVGVGTHAAITSRLALTFTAEASIYSFDPDGSASLYEGVTQADLVVTVGVPIALSH
jgi:hypothetical protein